MPSVTCCWIAWVLIAAVVNNISLEQWAAKLSVGQRCNQQTRVVIGLAYATTVFNGMCSGDRWLYYNV
jgi:hypothetical protein